MCRHGPVTWCTITRPAELVAEYFALHENSPRRRALDAQFGKKGIARMAKERRREKKTQAWLGEKTKKCPGCGTHIEKSHGESRAD